MTPLTIAASLAGLVAIATALGFLWRAQNGRVRAGDGGVVIAASDLPEAASFGSRATLLQFSTAVCAPCKPTRVLLGGLASELDDVEHLDVDLTEHPDLASRFNIMQTPTTFILDGRGVVRARIGGAPQRETLQAALGDILLAS